MKREDWREVSLGDICVFKYGKSLPADQRAPGSIPVYGSNGLVGYHSAAITQGAAIVIGRKGSIGAVHLTDSHCWPIDTTYYVDATATAADLTWLAYRLSTLGLTELNRAAAVPGLNREDAYRQRFLLPPPTEQRRIAAVLDGAAALRAKRRATISQLDSLRESMFLSTFQVRRIDQWPMTTIEHVASAETGAIRTGPFGSQLLHGEFTETGVAVLGIDNAVNNEFRWEKRRYISEAKYETLKRYTVHPGDVLITIMGTCGRCAVVPDDIPVAINTKHLCCISLDQSSCLPIFLHDYFLYHPLSRRYLRQAAKGAVMDGLNMKIVRNVPLQLPPLDVQSNYALRVAAVEAQRALALRSLSSCDALVASLEARAFRGEL